MLISRDGQIRRLAELLRRNPVVAILGARQVGKTTLARELSQHQQSSKADRGMQAPLLATTHHFDLENPGDLARLADPMLALGSLKGLVVLDEVQRRPDLFPVLRVLADRPDAPARFLILGSASPDLLSSSESLTGRIAYHDLGGLSLNEVGHTALRSWWLRGGFPRSFLAESDAASAEWRQDFIRSFLERDLPQLGVRIPAQTLRRFWTMVAHYHAQVWNGTELARAIAVADTTIRHYLDVLEGALVLRQLQPWHESLGKRQVKAPKIYVRDAGLLHSLLGIHTHDDLVSHPKVGASWEGLALCEVVRRLGARPEECFFWATYAGAELHLLVVRGRQRRGFEFKYTSAPTTTRSMHSAIDSLGLDRLDVIHAGSDTFPLQDRIRAVPLARIDDDLAPL